MQIGKRLLHIATMVRRGSRLADIGTDHAKLPIWLISQSICPCAIATEIRKGPADRACMAVRRSGSESRISVRLGDGLSPILPDEADDIVIAGMGGETIFGIIDAYDWTCNARYNFILQPMTKSEVLRKHLLTNGFFISNEQICSHGSHLYPILVVRFDPRAAAAQAAHPAAFIRGALFADRDYVYLKKQYDRLVSVSEKLRKTGRIEDAEILEHQAATLFL